MDELYSIAQAERDLGPMIARAPEGAVSGRWTATTEQTGVSTSGGGYADANGAPVSEAVGASALLEETIRCIVHRLEANSDLPEWNTITICWRSVDGRVTVTTRFDPDILRRGPDDPVYEQAAASRRAFWRTFGDVEPGYLAEDDGVNAHGQTRWFGPHRRVILVRRTSGLLLATDGLSTPWAGIAEKENGVGCEVCLELAGDGFSRDEASSGMRIWADLLVAVGDAIADDSIPHDIEANGPVIAFHLGVEYAPALRIVLSLEDAAVTPSARIPELPFGQALLLTATPVTATDLAGLDLSGPPSAAAARSALDRRAVRDGLENERGSS